MSRIISVVGATGAQGKGVVGALLQSGKWGVRALTRNPTSDAALALKKSGAEVVEADLNKGEDLEGAFKGAHGVFLMSTFGHGTDLEVKQSQLAVDVAKKSNISHFVFSSLANAEKISGGKNKVHHFTSKAKVADYMFQSGLPSTAVQIACYYENWAKFFVPVLNEKGVYEFTLPIPTDSKFALGSVSDLGKVVERVFSNKDKYVGKTVAVAGDYLSSNEIAATISKVWGKKVQANEVPGDVFSKFFPGADEIADMFSFFHNYGYFGEKVSKRDIFEAKKIVPDIKTFEQFLKESMPQPPTAKFNF